MEDMYIKPGNQERGWNDPPQFSYGLQTSRTPQKSLLTRRAAPPGSGAPPPVCALPNHLTPPPVVVATPPVRPGPMGRQNEGDRSQSQRTPDRETVMSVMRSALKCCRETVKVQICNDIEKRLLLLEDNWTSGRLSLPVQRRMDTLALELKSGHWEAADELHRSLMVDHVTEVSQWMVGVKRLIAETRSLSPEHLELFLGPKVPDLEPPGPEEKTSTGDQDTPAQDPSEPVQDP